MYQLSLYCSIENKINSDLNHLRVIVVQIHLHNAIVFLTSLAKNTKYSAEQFHNCNDYHLEGDTFERIRNTNFQWKFHNGSSIQIPN